MVASLLLVLGAAGACSASDTTKREAEGGAAGAGTDGGNAGKGPGAAVGGEPNGSGGVEASSGSGGESDSSTAGETGAAGGVGAAGGAGAGGAAGAAGAAGEAGAAEAATKASDGFEGSAAGWTITGDAQSSSVVPDYSGEGGNPDGLISALDDVTGGVWYFTAPERYLGDNTELYGGRLSFDVAVTAITSPFDSPDVELSGGGLTIAFDCTPDPGQTWTHYDVPLSEAGWTLTDLAGAAVTAEQFREVLAATTGLRLRGEFNTGADTGKLDNVKLAKP